MAQTSKEMKESPYYIKAGKTRGPRRTGRSKRRSTELIGQGRVSSEILGVVTKECGKGENEQEVSSIQQEHSKRKRKNRKDS